ncbi:MAG: DNA topoisomerase IB [Tatlockia sp.]|nr:DNA topoisomerase IB [Tatlockia sp.]
MPISLYSIEECEKSAKNASLRYVNDLTPGISRKRHGKGFAFYYADGSRVTDKNELKRIKALAIPPAYNKVWICPYPNGHIQATGMDNKNRKQYRYHPLWHEVRQQQKFHTMIHFGRAIDSIRAHVSKELSQPPTLNKTQIICAILYLLDKSCIRIGNSVYAKTNKTYGLTTLRKKHLSIEENKAVLDFEGKNSKLWHINIKDKKILRVLRKCEEIPGYELFKYRDETNALNIVTSQEINAYLQELTNHPFTAKDFRTWIASRETFLRLLELSYIENDPPAGLKDIILEVSNQLGHTPKICQKNYIYPLIVSWWQEGKLEKWKTTNAKKILNLDEDNLFLLWLAAFESA